MKTLWRAAGSVGGLIVVAALLQCGSSHTVPLLTITTAVLPNGTAGTPYSEQVQASGGVGPYRWGVGAGTLPANLQLQSDGANTATISGNPDTPVQGDPFTVKVIDSANQSASQPYHLSILALPDTLTLSPASLNFNGQMDGTASGTQSTTLTNTGGNAVAINSIVPTGNNAADFSQSNTCRPSVPAGANCQITVTFAPGQAGPRVASITITDDTSGSPHQLGLSGVGLSEGANATLSAKSLTFSGQEVGTTSPMQTMTLTNYGAATLNIASIAASGNFSESSTCATTLASEANCAINVLFSPTAPGTLTGTLSVSDNVVGSPQTITLNGTGAASGTPVLTGYCTGTLADPNQCGSSLSVDCPAGEVAIGPTNMLCGTAGYVNIDNSRGCTGQLRTETFSGKCVTGPASAASRAMARGSCQTTERIEE